MPLVGEWVRKGTLMRGARHCAAWILLPAWFLVSSLVSATLLARHVVPLPAGAVSDVRLAALRAEAGPGWLAVHVLYARCKCSEQIVHHLARRGPSADASEVVLWIGSQAALEAELEGARFSLVRVGAAELLHRFGIEAAPLLVILDPDDVARYTDRKQAYSVHDAELLREVISGAAPGALPLFGCAMSRRLREIIDPLRLF
jgi:hypothetical protein